MIDIKLKRDPLDVAIGLFWTCMVLVNVAIGVGIVCVAIHFIKKLW